ncbi:hypothetical protein M5E88_01750 [Akkermansia muciniphila]|nr:hypothetical protein M5E88_01750 [Akkermansia muciniphila]
MNSLARDGITHSLQFLFNVAGGTLHGAGVVDVPFTDGIRQVEYMRFQERFRLVRVRYFSASAGRKSLEQELRAMQTTTMSRPSLKVMKRNA